MTTTDTRHDITRRTGSQRRLRPVIRRAAPKVGRHLALVVLLAPMLLPVAVMLTTSLHRYEDLFSWPPNLLPPHWHWANYVEIWGGAYEFASAYKSSLAIGVGTSVLAIALGIPVAYVTSRFVFRGRMLLLFAVLAIQMISPVVFIVPLYQVMQLYGLLNTYASVIMASAAFATPMVVWLLHSFFQSIPTEMEEAALVDGCSRPAALIRIVVPLAMPGIATAATYAFILGWNELILPLTFFTDAGKYPIPMALFSFSAENQPFWQQMMAASVVAILPAALLFAFMQRNLVAGLTAGGTKT